MNSSHRDGWPPPSSGPGHMNMHRPGEQPPRPSQNGGYGPNAPAHQPPQAGAPVLPLPPGPFYPSAGPGGPGIPTLAGMPQPSPNTTAHRPLPPQDQPMTAQGHAGAPSMPQYTPLGMGQGVASQPLPHQAYERDREMQEAREREMRDRDRERDYEARRTEARDRDMQRQQREQGPPHQNHAEQLQLHQPVAVAPQVRASIHGPHGLLANSGPPGSIPNVAPNSHMNLFGPHYEGAGRGNMQQPPQPPPQSMMPFGNPNMPPIPGQGMAHGGGQPILNVSIPISQSQHEATLAWRQFLAASTQSSTQPSTLHHLPRTPSRSPSQASWVPSTQAHSLQDALSYLDQVKVQFSGEPNVYNQFLDIMKDFKSQAIDTPGVIRRVSQLFAGNPNLIQGFNTFLPPGYRIECGTAEDPNAIRVTTPMGTTVSPMGSHLRPLSNPRVAANDVGGVGPPMYETSERGANGAWHQQGADQADELHSPTMHSQQPPSLFAQQLGANQARLSPFEGANQREQHAIGVNAALLAHQQEQRGVSQLQNAASAVVAGEPVVKQNGPDTSPPVETTSPVANSSNANQQSGSSEKRGPVEFNHAISYVNKIKNRYSGQPEIYKQFLEILQTYQRESKPIQDVYAQVTQLFSDAPDLLQDFKQFLPESAAHAKAAAARQAAEDMTMMSNLRGEAGYGNQPAQQHHTPRPETHRLPPVGNFAPTPSAGRDTKRKRGERQGTVGGTQTTAPAGVSDVGGPSGVNVRTGFAPNKRLKHSQQPQQQQAIKPAVVSADALAVSPTLVPALPAPMPPMTTTAASSDELAFFDRVKKYVANKNTMNEFLKLCNLYSQDLIDKNSLVYRVQNFIGGNPDLFNWFKGFVDYDGKDQIIENRAKTFTGRVALNNCRAYGPSYRKLPKKERGLKCSGRDELCHRVLNDDWVSHPTWASEDSGFIAHRKNQYEEHLHRIEEERHDYDHYLAVLERSIQLLAPIVHQNSMMGQVTLTREAFGQGQSILKRALAKIYHREAAVSIMQEIFERPMVVVPVLLTRFKSKLEEWKASHREWEKVWRDATQKFFWRSLDHQGINAKMADKRQFQTKTLQNEIQAKYEEQKRQRQVSHSNVQAFQAIYPFDDADVLTDAARLLLTYAEHTHSTEFPRLIVFIKEFVPMFFGLDLTEFQKRIQDIFDTTPSNEEMDEDTPASDDASVTRGRKMNGKRGDLLRDVLAKGRNGKNGRTDKEGSVASGSRASTPDVTSRDDEEMLDAPADVADDEDKPKTWINHPSDGNDGLRGNLKPNEPFKRNTFNLYANLAIYCFFRMFVILYERLNHLKMNEKEVHEAVRRAKSLKAANDLKMIDKHPDSFFGDTTPTANYYSQMLTMLEDFLKGDARMDMQHIEEVLRRYYLQSGWMLYSFDKMLSALVRFAIAILSNDGKEKSSEILQLFTKDRRKETTTHQDELAYRKQVEKYIKDGDVYRIAYNQSAMVATIRILKKDETTFDSSLTGAENDDEALLTPEQRWNYYLSSYMSLEPTEGTQIPRDQLPLALRGLRSAMRKNGTSTPDIPVGPELVTAALVTAADADPARLDRLKSKEAMGLRISPINYRIHWSVLGSEEWWIAGPTQGGQPTRRKPANNTAASTVPVTKNDKPATSKPPNTTTTAPGPATTADSTKASTPTAAETIKSEAAPSSQAAKAGGNTQSVADALPPATVATTTTAAGVSAAADEQEDEHAHHQGEDEGDASAFEEKFVMNNRWMAGLSRDVVEVTNREWWDWRAKA